LICGNAHVGVELGCAADGDATLFRGGRLNARRGRRARLIQYDALLWWGIVQHVLILLFFYSEKMWGITTAEDKEGEVRDW
jgi:hypothetical protein